MGDHFVLAFGEKLTFADGQTFAELQDAGMADQVSGTRLLQEIDVEAGGDRQSTGPIRGLNTAA